MPASRYSNSSIIPGGRGDARSVVQIRTLISSGELTFKEYYLTGAQRLDTIAGREYGDGRYWWIIAAASDIGWGLQVPPGTRIRVPNFGSVLELIS